MIPVTTFAGKKVAVFGLGGSGLASASALLAGGADVVAFDDDAAERGKGERGRHSYGRFAQRRLVARSPRWCSRPAFRSRIRQPHWVVELAQKAGVEVIGDIELFCRERRRHAPDAPFVAITGTNGKSTTTALIAHLAASGRHGRAARRQYRHRDPVARAAAPRPVPRVHVIECSSYQIDLAPSLDPSVGILINLSEDHLDRHGTMEHYAAVKERLVAGVPRGGTAIVGVDDDWCRGDRRPARPVRQASWCAISVRQHIERRNLCRRTSGSCAPRPGRVPIAELGGIGSLRGLHNAQNAACAAAAALALGLEPAAIQAGLRSFPGPGASHGRGRPARRACSSSTIPRPPMPIRPPRRWPASATFSGSPAASRRPAASNRCARSFRASARPI